MVVRKFYDVLESQVDVFEENSGKSDVVPDMSLSVQQIILRFKRGTLDINDLRNGNYIDSNSVGFDYSMIDQIEDLVDLQNVSNQMSNQISHLTSQVNSVRENPSSSPSSDEPL